MQDALIVGTAACVWDDLKRLNLARYVVFAINDMGFHFPAEYHHWVSSHIEYFSAVPVRIWRWKHPFITHGIQAGPGVDKIWDFKPALGCDSAGIAARIAANYGFSRILLAGCPQDDSPHYYSAPGRVRGNSTPEDGGDTYSGRQRAFWQWFNEQHPGRIRSMSGLVYEMYGDNTC